MTMGEKILRMRKARGWSQEELAERMSVSRQAVSRWESGSAKPDADKIIALCDLFGVSADYLLREDYHGERSAVAASKLQRKWNAGKLLLGLYAVFSAISLFALKFMSSVHPKAHSIYYLNDHGRMVKRELPVGLLSYILHYNLEWMLVPVCIGLIVGLVLICQGSPGLREKSPALLKELRSLVRRK